MNLKVFFLLFCFGISVSLPLRIIMSPGEAEKIMKRESEFSDGLAGFVDSKLKDNPKQEKNDKITELKRIITNALQGLNKAKKSDFDDHSVSLEIKKDASPPGLPLDVKSDDLSSLEKLVDSLVGEVKNEKRKRGCHSGSCMINYGREVKPQAPKLSADTADAVDKILQSVKRLVNIGNRRDEVAAKKSADVKDIPSDDIISDSGDVGDKLLAKVNQLVKKKAAGEKVQIAKDSGPEKRTKAGLLEEVEKLLHKISQSSKKETKTDAGDLALNAVKNMVAKKERSKANAKDVKGQGEISLNDIKKEINELLGKMDGKSATNVKKTAKEVEKDDNVVESEAVPAEKKTVDKRRKMIVDLLKAYDDMTQKKSAKHSDVYANELESASRSLRSGDNQVSSQNERALQGFNVKDGSRKRSHPK